MLKWQHAFHEIATDAQLSKDRPIVYYRRFITFVFLHDINQMKLSSNTYFQAWRPARIAFLEHVFQKNKEITIPTKEAIVADTGVRALETMLKSTPDYRIHKHAAPLHLVDVELMCSTLGFDHQVRVQCCRQEISC